MRALEIRCDNCGRVRPTERPQIWWLLEDQGEIMRTGPLDFCSLRCLEAFTTDPEVRRVYVLDFPDEGAN